VPHLVQDQVDQVVRSPQEVLALQLALALAHVHPVLAQPALAQQALVQPALAQQALVQQELVHLIHLDQDLRDQDEDLVLVHQDPVLVLAHQDLDQALAHQDPDLVLVHQDPVLDLFHQDLDQALAHQALDEIQVHQDLVHLALAPALALVLALAQVLLHQEDVAEVILQQEVDRAVRAVLQQLNDHQVAAVEEVKNVAVLVLSTPQQLRQLVYRFGPFL